MDHLFFLVKADESNYIKTMIPCKPNFLIVGAAKSGTTALTNLLRRHPDIFFPAVKEPRYFAGDVLTNIHPGDPQRRFIHQSSVFTKEGYYRLFEQAVDYKVRGETSVHYLFHHDTVIPRVKKELGDAAIVILLRNPVIRALSNYYYIKKETLPLQEALNHETKRKQNNFNSFWYYKEQGFYYESVKAYLDNFSRVRIVLFRDFREEPMAVCRDIFSFLHVDPEVSISPDIDRNPTRIPKSAFRKFLLRFEHTAISQKVLMPLAGPWLREYKKTWFIRPDYYADADIYNTLVDTYLNDIVRLETLLNIPLDHWKRKIEAGSPSCQNR